MKKLSFDKQKNWSVKMSVFYLNARLPKPSWTSLISKKLIRVSLRLNLHYFSKFISNTNLDSGLLLSTIVLIPYLNCCKYFCANWPNFTYLFVIQKYQFAIKFMTHTFNPFRGVHILFFGDLDFFLEFFLDLREVLDISSWRTKLLNSQLTIEFRYESIGMDNKANIYQHYNKSW